MDYYRPFDDGDAFSSNTKKKSSQMMMMMMRRDSPSQLGTSLGSSDAFGTVNRNVFFQRQNSLSGRHSQPQRDAYSQQQQQQQNHKNVLSNKFDHSTTSIGRRRILEQQQQQQQHATDRKSMFRRSVIQRVLDIDTAYDKEDLSSQHSNLYMTLHPRSKSTQAKIYRKFTTWMVVLDLISFFLSTDPDLYRPPYIRTFRCIEGAVSTFFLVEYLARMSVVTENKQYYGPMGPIKGRLMWMCSLSSLIDVCATAPFFINWATKWQYSSLSYLRIFRLLRILKMEAYIRAFSSCYRVMHFNAEILYVAFLVCVFLVVVCAVLLYYLRPRNVDEADDNPNAVIFGSIPATLFTALLMLTGQDSLVRSSQDMPWYTKLVVGMTGVMSVVMVALPVSLLTWGFEAEALRWARKTRRKHLKTLKKMQSTGAQHDHRDSNSSIQLNSTPETNSDDIDVEKTMSMNSDIDYLNIISRKSSSSKVGDDDDSKMLDIQAQASPDIRSNNAKEMVERFLKDDHNSHRYNALMEFINSGPQPHDIRHFQPFKMNHQHHLDEPFNFFGRANHPYPTYTDDNDDEDEDALHSFFAMEEAGSRITNLESSVHSLHTKLEYLTQMLLLQHSHDDSRSQENQQQQSDQKQSNEQHNETGIEIT